MSLIPALLLALQVAPPQAVFDACEKAHASLSKGAVSVEVTQVLNGATTRLHFDLHYARPDQVVIRVREPEQSARAATDRTFFLDGSKLVGYDDMVHERLSRKVEAKGTLAERLTEALGTKLDDSEVALLDPGYLAKFLKPFRDSTGWDNSTRSKVLVLSKRGRGGNEKNLASFQFDPSMKLLRGLKLQIPGGRLEWSISYGPAPSRISYQPPLDAVAVASFSNRAPSAAYADATTRKIAERSMAAYDKLRYAAFRARTLNRETKIWLSGNWVREDSQEVSYVWDRRNGSILDRAHRAFYSGKAGTASMIDALAAVGTRMDPVVRQIVTRQNPIRVMLGPRIRVKTVGSVKTQGVPTDLMEFKSGRGVVLMAIRKDNGLLASVHTTLQDARGAVVSDSLKNYLYSSVGKPVSVSTFSLAATRGYKMGSITSLSK